MIKYVIKISTIVLLAVSVQAQDVDTTPVIKAFEAYKTAILNDQGEQAVEYVDSRTIKYYADILNTSLEADSLEIEKLSIMDKLMVMAIRHRTPKEDLLSFSAKELLVYAIQQGMVGKGSVQNNAIGEVDISEDFAKGQLVSSGMPTPMNFHFYYEEESWKIDLTSIFPIANQAFQGMADSSGMEENEYIFMLLEMMSGTAPDESIWVPVK